MFILLLILVFLVVNFVLILKVRMDLKASSERLARILTNWECFFEVLESLEKEMEE